MCWAYLKVDLLDFMAFICSLYIVLNVRPVYIFFVTFFTCFVRVIKARRMRWTGHVACMGEVRGAYNILVGRPEGRRHHWEDLGVDGRTTLRWISGKQGLGMWIGFIGLRIGTGGGLL
jgi:hypothetical protein